LTLSIQSKLVFSILILLMGMFFVKSLIHVGLISIIMGKIGILNSKQRLLVVQDEGGGLMSYSISRMDTKKANELINVINSTIAERG